MLLRCLFVFCLTIVLRPVWADVWQPSNMVIVISMDGMRHDYPDKAEFPGFMRMQKEGLRVQKMLPTFPSNTFPSHVSLATGTTPEVHGIIDNDFYDKSLRKSFDKYAANEWLGAEPIWITAERQGQRAAVYYWLGSEGAWQGASASYTKTPFKASGSEQAKVDQIIRWMDLAKEQRPSLIMSYWHGADSEGHRFGPEHFLVKKKIAIQDGFLQVLQKAIDERQAWDYVTLIVVSDHGMTEKGQAIGIADLLKQGKFNAYFKHSNAVLHLNLKQGSDKKEVFSFLSQQRGFDVYYPDAMPKVVSVNHAARSGDLVLVAKSGFYFSAENFFEKGLQSMATAGMHGLSPENPDMAAIFFAQGRGVKKASALEVVNMIDVAPSIASLLNINPPLQTQGEAFLPNIKINKKLK